MCSRSYVALSFLSIQEAPPQPWSHGYVVLSALQTAIRQRLSRQVNPVRFGNPMIQQWAGYFDAVWPTQSHARRAMEHVGKKICNGPMHIPSCAQPMGALILRRLQRTIWVIVVEQGK